MRIVIIGKNGQLAKELKVIEHCYSDVQFNFFSKKDIDVSDQFSVHRVLKGLEFDFCVNCSAYTDVDGSEDNWEEAYKVNSIGPKNLAEICKVKGAKLIHVSTDFVFNGLSEVEYKEEDCAFPLNNYGKSKLQGEQFIVDSMKEHFIIRTSWLYSSFGKNFVKTIIRLLEDKREIKVINDQFGSPTYAADLAQFIMGIINSGSLKYGIYHFCNQGHASWYEFASAVESQLGISSNGILVNPISSKLYYQKAKRPKYSVLSTEKVINVFGIRPNHWKLSLEHFFKKYKNL